MIAAQSPYKIDKLYDYAQKGTFFFGGIVIFSVALIFIFRFGDKEIKVEPGFSSKSQNLQVAAYESIGSGPLSLNEGQLPRFLHSIRKELVVLAKNTRPDALLSKAPLLLGLKHAGEEKVVESGEIIFIDCKEEGKFPIYHFSKEKTPLWIKPIVADSTSIKIEVGGEIKEKGEFTAQSLEEEGTKFENDAFRALQGVEWCGKDKFIELYGGEEYKEQALKQKLVFSNGRTTYACFVQKGDYLVWEEDRWKLSSFDQISKQVPLACVKGINSENLEIDAWDEKGFYPLHLNLTKKTASLLKMDEVITAMRFRNSSGLSCMVGKKRMLIKPGDWLVKTSHGWHKLRKASEIDDFLQHKLQGDLFVVDSFDKEMDKTVVKGQLFDDRRKEATKVCLAVNEEKKVQNKNKSIKKSKK